MRDMIAARRRLGFTLLELSAVIAIISILAATGVPAYDALVRRAHADEARTMIQAIAHAELQHYRDHGSYLACAPAGPIPQGPGHFPADEACWRALGLRADGDVRYRYQAALDGTSFVVTAEGDLDRDGTTSRFTLRGATLAVETENELE